MKYLNKTVNFHANGTLKFYNMYLYHSSNLHTPVSVFAMSMKSLTG